MKIFLRNQESNFESMLRELMARPTMSFDRHKLKEKTTSIDVISDGPLEQFDLDFLFDYKIFPSNIMTFLTQWNLEKRRMRVGDTILQQVFLPPTKTFSQKLVFGVRINAIIDEPDRKGFGYVTVEGHVEKGESIFVVEYSKDKMLFKINTFSEPGNLLTRIFGPILTRPYQTLCTRKALENVRKQLEHEK